MTSIRRKFLFVVILIFVFHNLYSSSTDEFRININKFILRVAWGLDYSSEKIKDISFYYDIISFCNNEYLKLNKLKSNLFFYCKTNNNKFILDCYIDDSKISSFILSEEKNYKNEILKILSDLVKSKSKYKQQTNVIMLSIPSKELDKLQNPYKFTSDTELYIGPGNNMSNEAGYTYIYFINENTALEYMKTLESPIIIYNKKIIRQDNISTLFDKTQLN